MQTLYIFGNGFDIAHGIRTPYAAFREFLKENHESFLTTSKVCIIFNLRLIRNPGIRKRLKKDGISRLLMICGGVLKKNRASGC